MPNKGWGQNRRLAELIAQIGDDKDVACYDPVSTGRRAGETIARSASESDPPKPKRKPTRGNSRH